MKFTVIIPARYASSRLPAKPLADINGKPMIQHVWEKAQLSGSQRVIVATDHPDIAQTVIQFGGEVCLTSDKHHSGTERLAEVAEQLALKDDEIIVNIQGDEPLIPPVIASQVAQNLVKYNVNMATLSVPLVSSEELFNPNVVKVISDQYGYALYFSRAPIPYARDHFPHCDDQLIQSLGYQRHIGVYAYRAKFIKHYVSWPSTQLEKIESLEQLRALWYGEKIHVALANEIPPVGVDTAEDLEKVRTLLSQ